MKKIILSLSIIGLLLISFSCKKNNNEDLAPATSGTETDLVTKTPVTAAAMARFSVIAGKANTPGYADGRGSRARFDNINGIFVNADGSLLVVEDRIGGGKIRKLQHDTIVTTLSFPPTSEGYAFYGDQLLDVAQLTNGTIATVGEHEMWIFKPGAASVVVPISFHDQLGAIDKDYTGNYFWIAHFRALGTSDDTGVTGGNNVVLGEYDRGFDGVSSSANGVKYYSQDTKIYKLTSSNVAAQIFTTLTFNDITSIVASRDGYKIYIADQGDIKVISNCPTCPKTIKTIASGVQAQSIALSNSEKYIYFTTQTTVNKLAL